jgi:predicted ATPase/DNA-binding SARP family transcriptional activator
MLSPLHISLLGSVSFQRNDKPLADLTAIKAQALLIYLAVTGRPHTRAALAGLLWPDVLETAAHNSLRVTLTQLRQAVGDYIDATRQSIALVREPAIWLDVTEFLEACSRLQSAEAAIEESEYQNLRIGVHLYRGDFMSGFYIPSAELFEEWVVAERTYYARLALDALTRLGAIALQRGSPAPGIEDAQAALNIDPLLEEAHQLLMQLYAHNGQTTLALRQYEACVRLLDEELGVSPAGETVALFEAIRTRTFAVPEQRNGTARLLARNVEDEALRRPRHNLPHQTSAFVGRTAELAALHELIAAPNQRLVTIVAPGGMGKSRLAQEAALAELPNFADGVYFVPLAPLSSANEVVPAIAAAVNYPMQGSEQTPQEQLLDFLHRKELLLVLDNFEHVLESTPLITEILHAAGAVKILVTSRERLALSSESLFRLSGLGLPSEQTSEMVEGADAVTLFVQHARRVKADFTLTATNWPAVARICRLTYGMPLGIVLAASWVSLLTVEEIATEIEQSLDFLEADLRDLPERQRSLASIFEHTWQRLSPAEQEAFMRLTVFRNGFDRQAAQVVAGATTRLLLTLADKALIQPGIPGRYEVHELLRQFGQRMLERTGIVEAAYAAHSRFFLHFVQVLEEDLKGRRQLAALAELEAELDNIRAAWWWALEHQEFELIDGALEPFSLFFTLRGRSREGTQILWQTYEKIGVESAVTLRPRVLVRFCQVQSLHYNPSHLIDQGLALALSQAEARGDPVESAACWFALGRREQLAVCEGQRPDFDQAKHYLQQSLACFRARQDAFYMARTAELIGDCYGFDYATMDLFQAYYAAALEHARQAGSVIDEAHILAGLGWASIDTGHFADAERYYREAEALCGRLPSLDTLMYVKLGRAFVSFLQGSMEAAAHLAQEGMALARDLNATSNESVALFILSLLASIAGESDEARQLAEQSLQSSPVRYFRSYSEWSLAIAHCTQGEYDLAWHYLRLSLQSLRVDSAFSRLLTVAAVLLGRHGDDERTVEVLGAVFSDPRSAHGWMEQWRPLTEMGVHLEFKLGAATFRRLWDRGGMLDTAALANALLDSRP